MDKSNTAGRYAPGYDSNLTLVAARYADSRETGSVPSTSFTVRNESTGLWLRLRIHHDRPRQGSSRRGIRSASTSLASRSQACQGKRLEFGDEQYLVPEVGNVYALDFPDNSFDAIFSHNVLEHLNDPARSLAEMQRGPEAGRSDRQTATLTWAATWCSRRRTADGLVYALRVGLARRERRSTLCPGELLQVLGEAGFADLHVSASYDVDHGEDARKLFFDVVCGVLSG